VWGQERKGIPGFAPGRLIRPGNRANAAAKARARRPSSAPPSIYIADRGGRSAELHAISAVRVAHLAGRDRQDA
jgi:hypothetical protein